MEKIIPLSQLKLKIEDAYNKALLCEDGQVDSRLSGVDAGRFGIAVMLCDGTLISRGDCDVKAPIGSIVKMPVASLLFAQKSACDIVKNSGSCDCDKSSRHFKIRFSPRGIRAISALEPVGDPDSKWNFIENAMIAMAGSAPVLDVKFYENQTKEALSDDIENVLARNEFFLYDDAASSIDLYLRAGAMAMSACQLAQMGATIANGGVNPLDGTTCFGEETSRKLVAAMAARGPHRMTLPWNIATGLPAKSSFSGMIMGVYPGLMSVAVYSPLVNSSGVSVKGIMAVKQLMGSLGLSVFGRGCVSIDKAG